MKKSFREIIEDCPVIAAVKDAEGLEKSLKSDCSVIFVLYGDICNIGGIVEQIKAADRIAMVHIDLITGLSSREISVEFLHRTTGTDGIITTKPVLVKSAKELGMYTVLRFFVLDSMAIENLHRQCETARPDCVEILPGVMPKVIRKIHEKERTPLIAGGLISDKEDIVMALKAGAVSISTTKSELWFV
jgi:glycerol-3-phosphate responsive antiterminator